MKHDEIVCGEFVELATEYLDGALAEADLERAEEHLVICALCRDYLDQIAATAAAAATAAREVSADDAVQALVAAFAAHTRDRRTS